MKKDYLYLGLAAVALYLLWKFKTQISAGIDAVSTSVANSYVDLTSGGNVTVLGSIVLPGGSLLPISSIYLNDSMQFSYMGATYQIQPRNAQGNYPAVRIG